MKVEYIVGGCTPAAANAPMVAYADVSVGVAPSGVARPYASDVLWYEA